MNLLETSTRRIAISKASTQMVIVASIASFITIFCLVSLNYLNGLYSFQGQVLAADQKANNQLNTDSVAARNLLVSYKNFIDQPTNAIGGNSQSIKSSNGGNNATIVLDALPSQYDFPALTTSIAKLLDNENVNITSIGGTDQSASISNAPMSNPAPVQIPFTFSIDNANYTTVQALLVELERSTRPMQIDSIDITGTDTNMTVSVSAHTYFQPAKKFTITKETIN